MLFCCSQIGHASFECPQVATSASATSSSVTMSSSIMLRSAPVSTSANVSRENSWSITIHIFIIYLLEIVCYITFKHRSSGFDDSPIWNLECSNNFKLSYSSSSSLAIWPNSIISICHLNWTTSSFRALISAFKSCIDKGFFLFHMT